jgi:adenylosuccinate lyase
MGISVFDMQLLQDSWSTQELRAVFSEDNRIQKWLDVEVALAQAQGELGVIPASAAVAIEKCATIDRLDVDRLVAAGKATKHSLVPLLRQLQGLCPEGLGEWLHYGATTQDILDTGVALQLKEAHVVIMRDLQACGKQLSHLILEHKNVPMVGRTHGVHALPITFGHKCAIWLDELGRHYTRLKACEPRVFAGMLVGAVGSQASFGPLGPEVQRRALARLKLEVPTISWAAARDRTAEYAMLLALLGGTLAKIGNELFNLQRTECGEVEEQSSAEKVGSSTMPHKRNPSAAENLAMLGRPLRYGAMLMLEGLVQESERDAVAWKVEWKALPECCLILGAMLDQAKSILSTLKVHRAKMLANLRALDGYLLSERMMLELGTHVGKQTAHTWMHEVSMKGLVDGVGLKAAMKEHPEIRKVLHLLDVDKILDPRGYLGHCTFHVDAVISSNAHWTSVH